MFYGDPFQQYFSFTEPLIGQFMRVGDRLLDVGCGDGRLAIRIAQRYHLSKVVGVDICDDLVREAQRLSRGHRDVFQFVHADAEHVDCLSAFGPFDVVLLRFCLHHFQAPDLALHRLLAGLPVGGRIILIDIDRESAWGTVLRVPLTLLITWIYVAVAIGPYRTYRAICELGLLGQNWWAHQRDDIKRQKAVGWYRYRAVRDRLQRLFPGSEVRRIGSVCGLGGVYFMIYEKPRHAPSPRECGTDRFAAAAAGFSPNNSEE